MTKQTLNKNEDNIKPENNIKRKQIILYSSILGILITLLIIGIIYTSGKNNSEAEAMGIYTHTKEGSEATDKLLEYKSNMEAIVEPTDGTMMGLMIGSGSLITAYQEFSNHLNKTVYNKEMVHSPTWNNKLLELLANVMVYQEAMVYDGSDKTVSYELELLDEKVKTVTGSTIELVATGDAYVAETVMTDAYSLGKTVLDVTSEIMKNYK